MATNTQTIVIQYADLTEYNNALAKANAWVGTPLVNTITEDQANLKLTVLMDPEQVVI